ncbi:hypothetical protein [Phenylobacterium sp.]|uniref:hypothetical protein n=1 Tax=Phenylobacterium sp. TaxID=1871053 RepID=UPI00374C9645
MLFDVRLPIGLLFLAIGLLVMGVGLTGDPKMLDAHGAGLNIDLVWGAVMAVFGAIMLVLTLRARRAGAPPPSDED